MSNREKEGFQDNEKSETMNSVGAWSFCKAASVNRDIVVVTLFAVLPGSD